MWQRLPLDKMDIYDGEAFRLIDSKGMEYNTLSQLSAQRQIKSWMRKNLDENHQDKCVHIIWHCVDATSARFSSENLKVLKTVTKFWKEIPVVVVITKSYSEVQRKEYEEMILDKIKTSGKGKINVKAAISVVAKEMPINDSVIFPAFGLDQLIDTTIELIPAQSAMVYGIGKIYGISSKDSDVINSIVDGRTISIPARAAV